MTFQRARPALGTLLVIGVDAPGRETADAALAEAFAAVDCLAARMHPRQEGSDLVRLACSREGEALEVHRWTWQVLRVAAELHRASDGAFDPCLPSSPGRLTDLRLRPGCRVVRLAPVAVDLGGIAKGFAVDLAVRALRAGGCAGGMVNAGGDLRVFGSAAHRVLIRTQTGIDRAIELRDAALAVSSPRSDDAPREHRGLYHGASRESVPGRWVAVTAPQAIHADALTKCAQLCPPATVEALLKRHGARLVEVS